MSDEPLPTAPHEPPSFGTYLALIMSDDTTDNQVLVAVRALRKRAKAAGIDGHDIGKTIEQGPKLLEAARVLKAENERLRHLMSGSGANAWAPVGSPQDQASWVFQMYQDKILGLSHFEEDFLLTISEWDGALTAKQRQVFEKLMAKVVRCTGRQPP